MSKLIGNYFLMSLQERLMSDMKTSMQEKDTSRTSIIRLLRSAIKNEEIKQGQSLDDAGVLKVLQREAKQRRDAIEQYQAAGRSELAEWESLELDVISEYLPKPLSDEELGRIVDEVFSSTDHENPQMGPVVASVMQRVGARADGARVAAAVRERLGR